MNDADDNHEDWDEREDWEILDDDDDGEFIGDFATIREALEFAIKDAMRDDSIYVTTFYADCGHCEIQVEGGPDDDAPRS